MISHTSFSRLNEFITKLNLNTHQQQFYIITLSPWACLIKGITEFLSSRRINPLPEDTCCGAIVAEASGKKCVNSSSKSWWCWNSVATCKSRKILSYFLSQENSDFYLKSMQTIQTTRRKNFKIPLGKLHGWTCYPSGTYKGHLRTTCKHDHRSGNDSVRQKKENA